MERTVPSPRPAPQHSGSPIVGTCGGFCIVAMLIGCSNQDWILDEGGRAGAHVAAAVLRPHGRLLELRSVACTHLLRGQSLARVSARDEMSNRVRRMRRYAR